MVFVVDDDAAVRDSMSLLLESYGLIVRAFTSAKEFLREQPELANGCLLLDLHMPQMSGLELLDRLRDRGATIPVIAMTGRYDAALGARVRDAGARDILLKPIDDAELIATIDRALNGAAGE
ncbi:MAG: response regulator transcription factor [Alphaproteobacteria bacterium]